MITRRRPALVRFHEQRRPAPGGRRSLSLAALLTLAVIAPGRAESPPAPWLELPGNWSRQVDGGVVAAVPGDLQEAESLLLLVEPPMWSAGAIDAEYRQALADLGPWEPVDTPRVQQFDNGWTFKLGVGVTELNGSRFTALTAVAIRSGQRARFWALANSDATFNRYQGPIMNAVASVQDLTEPLATAAPSTAPAAPGTPATASAMPTAEVYLGLAHGLTANAAANAIVDFEEVDVLFADGTYRRRLPIRGLGSDLGWERSQQPVLWGTWTRQGSLITVRRGGYQESYTVDGAHLIDGRGRAWRRLDAGGAGRIDGTFARADFRDPDAPRLRLTADGGYTDHDGFLRMVGSPWHLVEPDGDALIAQWSDAQARQALGAGSGRYTFENFTLTLNDRDGRVWQINAYLPPGESPARPTRLVINGRALLRD